MKALAFALLALFVALTAGSAVGLDLGCADDCDRGAPCREACASCNCNPVVPAQLGVLLPGADRPLVASSPGISGEPLPGVSRAVLHVPLFV
ncbi:MAG TPA: hypothetical protein VGS22_30565 [Thermoanaerobaculia bacterium]|jgi:hypothetical protein|nr:hypothetical protein [Thermoanaerobaculia bacterium]